MDNSSDSTVANGTPLPVTEPPSCEPPPASEPATKPVNPLRLARPLEKSPAGLTKTTFPSGRPMPMPTINPLCPPGTNQGKNGLKTSPTPPVTKNKTDGSEEVPNNVEKEDGKETETPVTDPIEKKENQEVIDKPTPKVAEDPVKIDIKERAKTPEETCKEKEIPASNKDEQEKEKEPESIASTQKNEAENKSEQSELVSEPAKKRPDETPAESPPDEKSPRTRKDSPSENKKKIDGPKIPVAEKTPRQPKRKKSQEVEPLGDDEKRTSKRSRAPPEVYKSPDPDMAHILKTIKKQEEEEKKSTVKNGNSDEETEKTTDRKRRKTEETKPATKSSKNNKRKKKVEESESESEEEFLEPEDESEEDDDYKPVKIKKTPPRKPIRKSKVNSENTSSKKKSGKKDPVFFKDEFLAVRNDEGSFYLCKALQNIYIGSRNITIQWLSNEEHIIPVKDNPKQDIFAPDFYDKTEFETILTSVELDKVLGKSKRMILPEEELARINKILQRSNEKAEGKLDMSNIELNEDNPDGLDISLYKGEDQLDEIEKRRTEKDKTDKTHSGTSNVSKQKNEKSETEEEVVSENKKGRGRPKKEAASTHAGKTERKSEPEPAETVGGSRRERRKASKNLSYDQFDFLEEDDDEVMPAPKKRKSQDSLPSQEDTKDKKEKKAPKSSESKEELSTSERAIIQAEKEKTNDEAEDNTEDTTTSNSENKPVKKRGRKPKTKE